MSELQIELLSEQQFLSRYWMTCPSCHAEVSGDLVVPEPDWSEAEESSQLQSEGESEVTCSVCEKSFLCSVHFTHGSCSVRFVDFPELPFHADEPRYWPPAEDWLHAEPSDDPFSDLQQAIRETKKIALAANEIDGSSLINRMCFSQLVSGFEAYLSDTLINAVGERPDTALELLRIDRDLATKKFSLHEIASNDDLVTSTLIGHLKSLIYHNVPRINPLYKVVFGTRITTSDETLKDLMVLVNDRHDCVHRNGRNKDGAAPTKFTVQFVLESAVFLEAVANSLEQNILAKSEISNPRDEVPFWF